MSPQSTPTRSRREDGSSVPSSPRQAGSPLQLTPKSKVKAILASFDQDSSEGEDRRPTGTSSVVNAITGRQRPTNYVEKDTSERDQESVDDDADDDADVVPKPRGRLARMMHGDIHQANAEPSQEDRPDDGAADERVRRQLQQKTRLSTTPQDQPRSATLSASDEDARSVPTKSARRGLTRRAVGSTEPRSDTAPPSSRRSSPGLFVSRGPSPARVGLPPLGRDHSDSDLPEDPKSDPRVLARVEQQRQERQAIEAAARKQKDKEARTARLKELAKSKGRARNGAISDSDSAVDQLLTQQARPSRKASKKALDEISRETQRMKRNMHLTHEATTKKKITTQSLFERFNFKPPGTENATIHSAHTIPPTSSTLPSDADRVSSTAPSSPPTLCGSFQAPDDADKFPDSHKISNAGNVTEHLEDADLPTMDQLLSDMPQPPSSPKRVKAALTSANQDDVVQAVMNKDDSQPAGPPKNEKKKHRRVINHARLRKAILTKNRGQSDSELEIVPVSKAKAILSEHVPQGKEEESHSLLVLRACAHVNMPDNASNKKASMTNADMQASLRRRARQQAVQERLEHLEELKKKGIVPQTAEERAKEEATIEDLLEKARKEAEELQKQEKAEQKRQGRGDAEDAILDDSSDEEDSAWDEDGEADVELSGSEEEEQEDDEDEAVDGDIEVAAPADSEDEAYATSMTADIRNDEDGYNGQEEVHDADLPIRRPQRRGRAAVRVISDDEAEPNDMRSTVEVPASVARPRMPKFPIAEGPVMGLTQLFAGTPAESQPEQLGSAGSAGASNDNSLDFLRQAPAPSLPAIEQILVEASQDIITDSQPLPSQFNAVESLNILPSPTQVSEFPDPTQDVGFSTIISPARPPASTIDTVMIDLDRRSTAERSPIKRRGRLQRKMIPQAMSEDEVEDLQEVADNRQPSSTDAFGMLLAESKKAPDSDIFNKKKSRAKEMVEEQAEESEDEYAGIGGDSDDGSGEEDADMSDLLDDEAQDVNEQDLAALWADKDRADDKRKVEKMYGLATGAFRRRRGGADLDLDDSDYDEEARRRAKRLEEAKLRRALLADENVERIATNPKTSAFFKSIEDRDGDRDENFLDDYLQVPDSQGDASSFPAVAQATSSITKEYSHRKHGSKRKRVESDDDITDENRVPPYRRGGLHQRPRTIPELRATLSEMVAPPNAMISVGPTMIDLTDDEDEDGDANIGSLGHDHDDGQLSPHRPSIATNPFELMRRAVTGNAASAPRSKVINRLSSARTNPVGAGAGHINNNQQQRMAFHNPSKAGRDTADEGFLSVPLAALRAQAALKNSSAALHRTAGTGTTTTTTTTTSFGTSSTTSSFSVTTSRKGKGSTAAAAAAAAAIARTKMTSTTGIKGSTGGKNASIGAFLNR